MTARISIFLFALALSTSAFARDEYTRHLTKRLPFEAASES